jgi:AcrR family transcriptional regulator
VDVGTTTLYRHVRDKEDLFVQLLNEITDQALTPELPEDPVERIVVAAVAIRDTLAMRPWAAIVLANDGYLARLGESAVGLVEVVVNAATEAGCTPEQAVRVFRNLQYYTLGEVLNRSQSARRPVDPEQLAPVDGRFGRVSASQAPTLASIGMRAWHDISARDTFASGVRAFTEGMLAQVRGHG